MYIRSRLIGNRCGGLKGNATTVRPCVAMD
jgi:hypothetical protein